MQNHTVTAALAPWDGRSALSACLATFHLVDSQRVHFRDGARVHGFVTNGGQAVNIIPERAACQFSVRATTDAYLGRLVEIVLDCARAAAKNPSAGCSSVSRSHWNGTRTAAC